MSSSGSRCPSGRRPEYRVRRPMDQSARRRAEPGVGQSLASAKPEHPAAPTNRNLRKTRGRPPAEPLRLPTLVSPSPGSANPEHPVAPTNRMLRTTKADQFLECAKSALEAPTEEATFSTWSLASPNSIAVFGL